MADIFTCRWCGGTLASRRKRVSGADVFGKQCTECGRDATLVDVPHQFTAAEADPSRCGGCGEGPRGRWHLEGGPTADEWLAELDEQS